MIPGFCQSFRKHATPLILAPSAYIPAELKGQSLWVVFDDEFTLRSHRAVFGVVDLTPWVDEEENPLVTL